jgi:hypothetical protein
MMRCRSGCDAVVHGPKKCRGIPTGNSMRISDAGVKRRSSAPLSYPIMAIPEIG